MKKIAVIAILSFLIMGTGVLVAQAPTYQGIVYVTPTGSGTHSGDSWANATSSIDTAQRIAQTNNAVVWVATGTYYGDTTSSNAFEMRDGVSVYGGFAGNEPANYDLSLRDFEVNTTILDGQNVRRVLYQPSSFYNQTTWDGFTIRNGNASYGYGGGVYIQNGGLLSHCKITNNSAYYSGSGVYAYNATITHCEINGNNSNGSSGSGGGLYASNTTITHCEIIGNNSNGTGGGIYAYSSIVKDCHIEGNTSRSTAGGIYASSSTVRECRIEGNNSGSSGGGVSSSGGIVANCWITRNQSSYSGGGIVISNTGIRNCLVANNSVIGTSSSNNGGGGISGSGTVVNTTIVHNSSKGDGAGVNGSASTSLSNCIVWGNEQNGMSNNLNGSSIVCSNCAVENGYPGTRMVFLDNNTISMFVNPSLSAGASDSTLNVNWHLQQGSVCVNRGNNSMAEDSLDLDGTLRIKRDTVDIGCYESDYYSVPMTIYDSIIYVTVTGSGTHSGNSWANATSSIWEAQTLAQTYDAVVWVAGGTYYGDTTSVDAFTMRDGVSVYGGFAGNEPANYDLSLRDFETNATVLDGQNARRVLYQPFQFNKEMEWNGFTIRNGKSSDYGGGVYLRKNSRLSYCKVLNNISTGSIGGGIYCTNSYVANCEIRNNNIMHEYPMGGGVYSAQSTIQNCVVSENVCRYGSYGEGGGIYAYSSIIKGCTLRNNKSESGGGGVYARTNTSVMNCVIRNNESGDLGGGIYASAAIVSNCEITNNKTTGSRYAYGGGGGIYSASSEIINCLISNNTSKSHYGGGGINISNTTISNSTVTRNNITGSAKGSGIYVHENTYSDLSNCIVWGNENIDNTGDSEQIYGHIDGLNSAVEGGYPGTGMVLLYHNDGNPLFLNPSLTSGADDSTANVDWHLQQGSLCINSGDNSLVTDSLDLDGTARIKRDTVDLGCYESDYYSTPVTEYDSIIYVTVTGAGTHSGNSWVNATSSIDMAQLLAQTYNAVVWVAAGTYYGDTTSANAFTMRDGVNVFGGFVGNEPANFDLSQRNFEANATVLDGQNARRVLYQPFSFYAQATWDGFTIQNGQISGEGGGVYLNENGALSCCVIRNNTANNNNGGGVRMYRSKVSNCLIIENKAVSNSNGGNIYGGRGGGVYVYDGAGVCTTCPGNSLIIQCKILNNTAYSGAGVAGEDSYISNCLISNNTATQTGGGISGGRTVINTTIVRNVSGGDGAGVLSNNNTKLKNCIVWGNERNGASGSISGTFTCSYSAVEGGADGDSNIMLGDVNPPFFVNPSFTAGAFDSTANVDWHLQAGSPCINRGDNSVVTDSLDLDGMARIKNDIVDIGCYESDYSIAPVVEYDSIIYVTVTGAGTHSGNSWANATSSIENAQALAQTYNAVVWVAAGTYVGDTTASNAFTMRDGVSVYGGFAGNEPANFDLSQRNFVMNTTILDGQNARRVLYQPSGFNNLAEWNGFTVQNGQSSVSGGGAYLSNNGVLNTCIINNNTATNNGAGVCFAGYTMIKNCVIRNNVSTGGNGGGVGSLNGGGSFKVDYCEISGNKAVEGGGTYGRGNISNSLISNNTATQKGGGVSYGNKIVNTTIVRNKARGEGSGSAQSYTLSNSIVWGNVTTNGTSSNISGNTSCSYSAIEGGYVGNSNITLSSEATSLFVNPSLIAGVNDTTFNVDWHLKLESECVNRGNNSVVTDSLDLDGTVRIKRDTVDLGCYESDFYSVPAAEYDSIIYVTVTGAGTHSGNSWENAISTIEGAQAIAQTHNAVVWVAAGIYCGDTTATSENVFTMREGVSVYGGFVGNEPANYDLSQRNFETNATVLDGKNSRRVLYQPADFNTSTTWNGFTIRNGKVSGVGAGAYLRRRAVLSHCKVEDNVSTNDQGGGVYCTSAIVEYCDVLRNTGKKGGGGIYAINNSTVYGCRIENNATTRIYSSDVGGGGVYVSSSTLKDCNVAYNVSTNHQGGGVYAYSSSIVSCRISHNQSSYAGGGIRSSASIQVLNCLIDNNMAGTTNSSYGGGGISGNGTIVNTTIVNNTSTGDGAGVNGTSSTQLQNCIVWGNLRNGVTNSINGSSVRCSYSAIEGGYAGDSIIVLNDMTPPLFINPSLIAGASDTTANVDWHLQAGSPCINRGDNSAVTDSLDLDGTARIKNDTVDMGCYESDYNIVPVMEYDSIIYVSVTGAGTRSGNSWANAISSIEEAQSLAITYDAVVWVAAGTYYGDTTSTNAFTMRDGVSVYGGFAGNEPANFDLSQRDFATNATILDGQNARRVLYQSSDFSKETEWNGFTIQHGLTNGVGGGAYIQRKGKLHQCCIRDNKASGNGGGIYCSNTDVTNCMINNNHSDNDGGGMYVNLRTDNQTIRSFVRNCKILNNNANGSGGGLYSNSGSSAWVSYIRQVIDSCEIVYNSAGSEGGGAVLRTSSMSNCVVMYNQAVRGGGVVATQRIYYESSSDISQCMISHNQATEYGGGVYLSASKIINCLLSNNSTLKAGGGVYGDGTIKNLTIVRNTSFEEGAGVCGTTNTNVSNCIIWGNEWRGAVNSINGSSVVCSYSAVEGGYSGISLTILDNTNPPLFANPSLTAGASDTTANEDWHLQIGSVCVNRGNNAAVTDSLDLDGTARIKRDTVDMGCYESDFYSVPVTEYDSIIYVTVTGAGTHSGNSWANATSSVEEAQALAITHNAVVWVAAGTYYGDTTSTNAFTMRDGVSVYGGFAGNEPANYDLSQRDFQTNITVLDGQNARRVLYQPFDFSMETEWNGFEIRNGNTPEDGAGAYIRANSMIRHCAFKNNTTQTSGGGLCISLHVQGGSQSWVKQCIFTNNTAGSYGGGIYFTTEYSAQVSSYATISSCLISNNTAGRNGGGVNRLGSGRCYIYNTTITRNKSGNSGGGASESILTNCIVWGNERNNVSDNLNSVTCTYSAVEGGYAGVGNVMLNNINRPLFVNPSLVSGANDSTANVDWHLQNGSVCVNRGNNAAVTDSLDLDGMARIKRDTVDLGCYESDFYSVPVLYCTTVYSEFSETACDSYIWNDQLYTRSDDYRQIFPLDNGCDSIVTLHLTVNHSVTNHEYITVCENELSYSYRDTLLDISSPQLLTINYSLLTQVGCDSTIVLHLTVLPDSVGDFAAMTPTDNYPVTSYPVRFTWDAVENASGYDLFVWSGGEPQPQQPVATNIHGTSYSLSSLPNRGTYRWFMKAYNACDTSVSAIRNFSLSVKPALTVNASNPVDFGEVALNSASSIFFQVRGTALDSAITYQITGTDASAFSLVPTTSWDSLSGGRMQLTFYPQTIRNEYVAQMTFRSDTLVRTFNIKGYLSDYLTFTTYVDSNVYATDSDIPVHGRVTNPLNEPVAGLDVEVYVKVLDYVRTYPATTDTNGQFTIIFTPQHSEAGYYTVGSRRLGGNSTAVHDDFNIPGMMLASSDWILWTPTIDQPDSGTIAVRNRSQIPLTNIQVTPLSLPNGCTVHFDPLNLAGMATGNLTYTVSGSQVSTGVNYEEVPLAAVSDEGAAMSFNAWYYCIPQRADLDVTPTSLTTTMTRGRSKIVDFKIYNNGTGPTGNIFVSLPDVPWMSVVGSDTLPSLAVHDSAYVSIRLVADSADLIRYTGNFAINCERGEGVSVPYSITAISDSTGTLVVDVTDEYSWNTNNGHGPHLAGANVTVKGYYSLETVATGITDSNGLFTVSDLPEGYYKLIVRADRHEEYQGVLEIVAGDTNRQDIFIQFQAITYSWDVVPTEIQDEYTYELNVEFETHVPKPVVVLGMPENLPALEEGESYTFDYILTNHGLVSTYDVQLFTPESSIYTFTPLVNRLDSLPAQTTQIIPCVMSRPVQTRGTRNAISTSRSASYQAYCPYMIVSKVLTYYLCAGEKRPIWAYVSRNVGSFPCDVISINSSYITTYYPTYPPIYTGSSSSSSWIPGGTVYYVGPSVTTPLVLCECKDEVLRDTVFLYGMNDVMRVVRTRIKSCVTNEISYSSSDTVMLSDDPTMILPDDPQNNNTNCEPKVTLLWGSGDPDLNQRLGNQEYRAKVKGVVADGTSTLKIRISTNCDLRLEDPIEMYLSYNGQNRGNNVYAGTILPSNRISDQCIEVVYRAPSKIPNGVGKEYQIDFICHIRLGDSIHIVRKPILIRRVPVLLVHGLSDSGSCFDELYKRLLREAEGEDDGGGFYEIYDAYYTVDGNIYLYPSPELAAPYDSWQLLKVDYESTNLESFYVNVNVISKNIRECFNIVANNQFVVSKADIVGHSMGGILARLHVQEVDNTNVHKLITLNTPHSGSQGANLIMHNPIIGLIACAKFNKNGQCNLDAVNDLQVGSVAMQLLNNPSKLDRMNGIPIHSIATVCEINYGDISWNPNNWILNMVIFAANPIEGTFSGLVNGFNYWLHNWLYSDYNDIVVSLGSQKGGLEYPYSSVLGEGAGFASWHSGSPYFGESMNKIVRLLTTSTTDPVFCTTGFRPVDIPIPTSIQTLSNQATRSDNEDNPVTNRENRISNRSNTESTIQITASYNDTSRQIVSLLDYSDDIDQFATMALFENGEPLLSLRDTSFFDVPPTYKGIVTIYAIGQTNEENIVEDSTYVVINNYETTPQGISFIEDTIHLVEGETIHPSLECAWANGDTTYVTPTFSADSNIVSIESGTVRGNHAGITNLVAHFEGLTASIPVIVYGWDFDDDNNSSNEDDSLTHNTVCASVTVQFSQKMTMTREAFEGTLTINNGHESQPMQNIDVNFVIRDENGVDCTNLFQINFLSYNNMTGTNGTADLAAQNTGSMVVQFIPTKMAAPVIAKQYSFGGSFSFIDPFTGESMTYNLYPVDIMVNPSPDLYVNYFMQRDILGDDPLTEDRIEPIIPAELGVIIHNRGAGTAKNVLLETAEPKIIENEKGLAIDFAMYGAAFNGNERQLGLKEIPFGNIEPGRTGVGEWWFTSTLLGHFVSYEAHVIHNNSFGNPDLSLVSSLDIHPLIHTVYAYGNLDDGINDFLVDDIEDIRNYPDSLYFSNGSRTGVATADSIGFDHYVTPMDTVVQLTLDPSRIGWNYEQTWDPGRGQYKLISCTRNRDSQVIPLSNVWQTHVTIPVGADPIYENRLHIVDTLDNDLPTTYTLVFSLREMVLEVDTIMNVPDTIVRIPLSSVDVIFNKPIVDSTFTFSDMSLKCNNGSNLLDDNLQIEKLDAVTYRLHLAPYTSQSGYYVLNVQTLNITDTVGFNGYYGKQVTWIQNIQTCVPVAVEITKSACESFMWLDSTYTQSGDYVHRFTNASGCDSIVTLHLTINYTTYGQETITACDSFSWHGSTYTQSGDYPLVTTNAANCDSLVTLHLTVNYTTYGQETVTACDSFSWHGSTYTQSGDYPFVTTNAANCDSIVTLHLTVNRTTYGQETVTACDSFSWHGNTYTQSGDYPFVTTNAANCDSIVTLHLTVKNTTYGQETVTACDRFSWHGSTYTQSGDYPFVTTNSANCDSLVTLHLTVNYTTYGQETVTACDSFSWHGSTYTQSGDYPFATTNAANCDSLVTLHLTVNHTTYGQEMVTACDSFSWHGSTYTQSGDYPYLTTNAANCDSIVTLHLTVNYTTYGQETVTACDSFIWHGSTYTQSGDYPYLTTNAANCDSVVTLHLTVNHTTYGQETVTACDSFTWHGSTYTQSGDYPFVTTNAANCDSVVTLHLTIGFEILANISAAICEGEDYMVDGFSVINPPAGVGEYWDTIPRLGTCDSIVQLTLTVLPKPTMSSIIGDSVICKNQYATYYYDISDNNYRYLWLKDNLPWAENVSSVVLHETDSGTVFLTMQVEDQWNSCMASTSMLVQIQNSYAPDTTVIRRKGNSNILVCQPVTSEYGTVHYQWGYADRFIQEEVLMNGDYNYCQFDVGIDTSRYDYWVETYVDVPDGLSCANRTYYGRNTDVSVEDYDGNKIEAYFVQDRIVLSVNAANPNDIGAGLYDVNGRLLLSKEYGRTDNVQDAVSVRVAAGVYFLKVNIGGQMYSVKLLKF